MAERMQQQFEEKQQASSGVVAYKQRQQRRKEYMEQTAQVTRLQHATIFIQLALGVGVWCRFHSACMGVHTDRHALVRAA
jgi:hypothetical protein